MTRKEVYAETLKYFSGDDLAANVFLDKYCLRDAEGEYLESTPDDMHKRLAKEFARIEKKYPNPLSYDEIYKLLHNFTYIIPGGSILYGCGNPYSISSLGNCFVIGNNSDSYGGILQTDEEQAQLMKRRAGVGLDISHLRPSGAGTSNSAGTSTGAISFMHRYSNTTREVAQNGRRGALMITIDISHPDSEQFITSKDDLTKITGANISVKVDNRFMKAVESDSEYYLGFIHGNPKGKHSHTEIEIKAKPLWDALIHQAWKTAEPGCLFWNKIKSESIPSCYGEEWEEKSTNPCGEIPLCPYDSCRLMSINLYSFVENPFTLEAKFDYEKFKEVTYKAQRLMDDVVDLEEEKINKILNKIENDPEPEEIKIVEKNLWIKIKKKLLEGRRTGLSAIGLADCLAANDIRYGSREAIELAEEIYKQFAISAYKSSIDMAKERGTFPIWNKELEKDNRFLARVVYSLHYPDNTMGSLNGHGKFGRRNISLLAIPPSGTISLLSKISSGIEPVYQLHYKRRYKVNPDMKNHRIDFVDQNGDSWQEHTVLHPKFKEWYLKQENICNITIDNKNNKIVSLPEENVLLETINKVNHPYHNSTAYEIDPIQRVKLQATIQKWIDHSISSTINLPETTTEEEISNIYMTAWKEGCKGITIYRNNCRTGVLIDNKPKETNEFKQHNAPKRPKELPCEIHTTSVKGQKFYVITGLYDNKPYEVFAINSDLHHFTKNKGKVIKISKGNYSIQEEDSDIAWIITEQLTDEEATITRLTSTSLRHGADIKFIVDQLNKTQGDLTQFGKGISRILKRYIKDNEKSTEKCPECQSELIYKEGCKTCQSCGYSGCS